MGLFSNFLSSIVAIFSSTPRPIAYQSPPSSVYDYGGVAGIESILIDNQRHYFGFAYGIDCVASDLFTDPEEMAAHAATFLEQRDGPASDAVWKELVAISENETHLTLADDPRSYSRKDLIRFANDVRHMASNGAPPSDRATFSLPPSHLLYLIAAAGFGERYSPSKAVRKSLATLNPEDDWEDSMILDDLALEWEEIVRGERPFPEGATWKDLGLAFAYTQMRAQHLNGRWREAFDMLAIRK